MIHFTTGNILEADTEALVNTVNCDGFMGKGIAYQFKLKFPNNNIEYINECKNNNLKIGKIFVYEEDDKFILNFPTKENWRKKSEYKYIEEGLIDLKRILIDRKIKSVSIPPLGCGNGGLDWSKIKKMLLDSLNDISNTISIVIYEPLFYNEDKNFTKKINKAPTLSSSHLLLMLFKKSLTKFNNLRLQKALYINNIISGQKYFRFEALNYGPYAHSIKILSRDIKEYQDYYNIKTEEAYLKALQYLVSKSLNNKVDSFRFSMKKTVDIVNTFEKDIDLELFATILFLIDSNDGLLDKTSLIKNIHEWNEHKKNAFSEEKINYEITHLLKLNLIEVSLYNTYNINQNFIKQLNNVAH